MDITGKIEEVNQSDSLLLVVFYADWSPHCEWIEPLLHEFEKPVNIVRVNIESNRKVADAYEIEIAPSFVLQRKDKVLWEKTGKGMSLKCSRIEICTSRLKKFRWYTATGLFFL